MKQLKALSYATLFLMLTAMALSAGNDKKNGKSEDPQAPSKPLEITWLDYDVGLTKAKSADKHVFIDFTAKWCGYCRKMEQTTFADEDIINMINKNFVAVRVNGDSNKQLDIDGYKISEKNLSQREYGVRGYPSFWFLKSDGTKLGSLRGYQSKTLLAQALTYVYERQYDSTQTTQTTPKEGGK